MADLAELLKRIDTLKAELDQLRPLDREREARVLQKFRLWWTYHSNAIEGNALSQGETEIFLMEGLTAKGKPLKDHLDLKGHNDAINFLLALVKDGRPLTETDIRELHRVLLVETYKVDAITPDGQPTSKMVAVGQYKTSANHVKTPTGEIHYYATPEETPAKMHELMTWYREEVGKGIIPTPFIVAKFHHRFTAIHPFDDGNGRMSRLLMNLMLMQEDYPPAVIRLGERNAYLAALRLADRGEYDEFISFIGERITEALQLYIRAAKGESVSEPTDTRKEIALELLRLKHIEEPATQTPELLVKIFRKSIHELVNACVDELLPFCEVFTNNTVGISVTYRIKNSQSTYGISTPLIGTRYIEFLNDCYNKGWTIIGMKVSFSFSGFRKARFDTFDLANWFQVNCESIKYSVTLGTHTNTPFFHFYQEELTREEIRYATETISQFFLKSIQAKTKESR